MTYLEEFVAEIEFREAAEDMHFSVYYVPEYYQPEDDPYL